jgi:hypothetical protein
VPLPCSGHAIIYYFRRVQKLLPRTQCLCHSPPAANLHPKQARICATPFYHVSATAFRYNDGTIPATSLLCNRGCLQQICLFAPAHSDDEVSSSYRGCSPCSRAHLGRKVSRQAVAVTESHVVANLFSFPAVVFLTAVKVPESTFRHVLHNATAAATAQVELVAVICASMQTSSDSRSPPDLMPPDAHLAAGVQERWQRDQPGTAKASEVRVGPVSGPVIGINTEQRSGICACSLLSLQACVPQLPQL